MQYLWAPWRMKYLKKAAQQKGCFICQALREKQDRKNLILTRTNVAIVMMNRYPYNTGHLMIAPRRHVADLETLTDEEIKDLFTLLKAMKQRLEKVLKPEGFNIGLNLGRVAGAGLKGHLHIHLVPRWVGDTNFMPIIGQTKIISQALDKLYLRLVNR